MNSAHVNILVISLFSAKKRCAAKYFRFGSCFSLYFAQNLRFALFYSCFVRLLSLLSDTKKTFLPKPQNKKRPRQKAGARKTVKVPAEISAGTLLACITKQNGRLFLR